MEDPIVFPSEYRFCKILWEQEPIATSQLVFICDYSLGWSKSTTYTVIHRLIDRGVIKKEASVCSSLVSKRQIQIAQLQKLVAEYFDGDTSGLIEVVNQLDIKEN